MALAATVVFEVRSAGADTNGGGFDPGVGSPGTDFSTQNAAQIVFTDLVVDATTNTKVTSAANPFGSTHPGNLINITSGAGWTTGWYEVLSVSGVIATLDRSPAATTTTGGHGNLGGAMASIGAVGAIWVTSNFMFVKRGTYTISATANVAGGRLTMANGAQTAWAAVIGYDTNRVYGNTDIGPTLQAGANSVAPIIYMGQNYGAVYNIIFQGNGNTGCWGIRQDNNFNIGENCQFQSLQYGGYQTNANVHFYNCYATSCTNGFVPGGVTCKLVGCVSMGSTSFGFNGFASMAFCIAANSGNTGFYNGSLTQCLLVQCTSYNNTGAGFDCADQSALFNCVATKNSTYGFNAGSTALQGIRLYNCAGYNNTTADIETHINKAINKFNFVTLSADPFNNAAGNDFSLNNTAGGGASLRSAGFPASYLGISTNSYFDIGAADHADPSGTTVINNQTVMVFPDTSCIGY